MKTSNILNVLLAVALVILSAKLAFFSNDGRQVINSSEAAIDNIMSRTSIRAYTDQPVDEAVVEKILRAGMAAPTAMNKQPWDFVVVDDAALLRELADSLPYAKMTAGAPLAIVVCGNLDKAIEGVGADFWVQDASAATENILLAAHALGLGAVWTGVFPSAERAAAVSHILELPAHVIPLCVIPMGYPAEQPQPKDKWKAENVRRNTWNGE